MTFINKLETVLRKEDGQGLAEYALILALIAVLAVTALIFLGILMLAFDVRRARILPLALGVAVAIHYAFYSLLRVPLPWGVLEGVAW